MKTSIITELRNNLNINTMAMKLILLIMERKSRGSTIYIDIYQLLLLTAYVTIVGTDSTRLSPK